MKLLKKTSIALALLSGAAFAQDTADVTETSMFYLSLGSVGFDSTVSATNGVDDSATYLRLGYRQEKGTFSWGVGLSGFLYDDNNGFSQATQDNFGNNDNSSSSAESINGYIEAGYTYHYSEKVRLSVFGGLEQVFSSQRSIPNCSNCFSEDIEIDAGLYVHPSASYTFDNGWYGELGSVMFLSGDAGSAVTLTVGAHF